MKKDLIQITILVTALLISFVSVAVANPVSTWSGAGPNACHGNCSLEWAESQLTQDELAQLRSVQQEQPDPQYMWVNDGDVFTLATYFKDGEPVAYRTTTVAMLEEPTGSEGWQMEGWSFVKLHDCSNWTIITHDYTIPTTYVPYYVPVDTVTNEPHYPWYVSDPPEWPDFPDQPFVPTVWPDPEPETPIVTDIPNVPLPASFWFLFSALGLIAIFNGKMRA